MEKESIQLLMMIGVILYWRWLLNYVKK